MTDGRVFPSRARRLRTGRAPRRVLLTGARVTVGRLADANDVALEPDPQQLVTRTGHLALERRGVEWFLVDGGSVNGTFLRRGDDLVRVTGQMPLHDGDVACVLATVRDTGERSFFELSFHAAGVDSQATRAAPPEQTRPALTTTRRRPARAGAGRGAARAPDPGAGAPACPAHGRAKRRATGTSALCTHEELMAAVWGDEPLHTREELAKLVWELRHTLEPFGAEHLVENVRGLGYRMRTCDV